MSSALIWSIEEAVFALATASPASGGRRGLQSVGIGKDFQPDRGPLFGGDTPQSNGKGIAVIKIVVDEFAADIDSRGITDVVDSQNLPPPGGGGEIELINGSGIPGGVIHALQIRRGGPGGLLLADSHREFFGLAKSVQRKSGE